LWAATAIAGSDTPPMGGKLNVDVAIVGAGFTGLSAALHLSELGATVCVLEAGEPGWGASGRNGGQVIPGLKYDPGELERRYPGKVGEELIALVGSAPDVVFDLIRKHGIDCDATRAGWIQPAHTNAALQTVLQRAEQWRRRGVPVELLDSAETARRLGTNQYVGAWQDPRGGSIHPLSFSRGLAAAAIRMGTEIHGCSSVTGIARVGLKWHVSTATGGLVMADQVLLCTNEYTEKLWPRLRQTIIAANSFQVTTCPLPPEISSTILPGGEIASDSRRLLSYFRKDRDGRLILGGRGPFREPRSDSDYAHLRDMVYRLFPQVRGRRFGYQWSGRVALTADFLPHVHVPACGITVALGYNGRGIAMATTMGRVLANCMNGTGTLSTLPFYRPDIKPVPLHSLQQRYLSAGIAYYRMRDRIG
jgi:hypothetical protein